MVSVTQSISFIAKALLRIDNERDGARGFLVNDGSTALECRGGILLLVAIPSPVIRIG